MFVVTATFDLSVLKPDPNFTTSAETLPVTSSEVNEPTLVMLGCAAVVNVPVTKLADTKFAPVKLLASTLPVTLSDVNVPTEVMFGCAAVYTVPATNALPT